MKSGQLWIDVWMRKNEIEERKFVEDEREKVWEQ